MKITVREDYILQLDEVYNPIAIRTNEGDVFYICQRDYGIEITCNDNKTYLGRNKKGGFIGGFGSPNTEEK